MGLSAFLFRYVVQVPEALWPPPVTLIVTVSPLRACRHSVWKVALPLPLVVVLPLCTALEGPYHWPLSTAGPLPLTQVYDRTVLAGKLFAVTLVK
jgi:hypothetical protein